MSKTVQLSQEEQNQLKHIQGFYSTLDKLVRSMKMYQGKGALVDRQLSETLKKASVALESSDIVTKITPIGPIWLGEPVFDDGRPPLYLFQLYCDGVRELTVRQGIEADALLGLADVFIADYAGTDDDMVTALWRQNLETVRYYAVDALGAQMETEDFELSASGGAQLQSEAEGEELKLSSSDMRLLKSQDSLNWVQICSTPSEASGEIRELTQTIQEKWTTSADYQRFLAISLKVAIENQLSASSAETAEEADSVNGTSKTDETENVGESALSSELMLLRNLLLSTAQQGDIEGVVSLLSGLIELGQRQIPQSLLLLEEMFAEENLPSLASLYQGHLSVLSPIFNRLIDIEDFDASVLIGLLTSLSVGEARQALQQVLSRSTVDMTAFYLDGLDSEETEVVQEALSSLGQIGTDAALMAIYSKLGHPLTEIRSTALAALGGRFLLSQKSKAIKVLRDPDRDNRLLGIELLSSAADRSIGPAVLGIIQGGGFGRRDLEEQELVLRLMAKFPSPLVVAYFDGELNGSVNRSKGQVNRQLMVVSLLVEMGTPDAVATLEKAKKRWLLSKPVKDAIATGIGRIASRSEKKF